MAFTARPVGLFPNYFAGVRANVPFYGILRQMRITSKPTFEMNLYIYIFFFWRAFSEVLEGAAKRKRSGDLVIPAADTAASCAPEPRCGRR